MDKKLNGFNNGRDTTDGVGVKPWQIFDEIGQTESLEDNMEIKEVKTLRNKVFEALGEVSMCWSETPKGIFESSRAEEIGNRLMKDIEQSTQVFAIDVNMIPENMNIEEFLKTWKQQPIQIFQSKPSVKEAIEVLCNALREDTTEGSYYYSWQANIAMAFVDEMNRENSKYSDLDGNQRIHKAANEAAKNFLNLLISQK